MAVESGAWQPAGWVWHSWPYQYSAQSSTWYYLQEGQDMWGLNLTSVAWQRLRDIDAAWVYFSWPYAYVLNTGTWYWLNEAGVLWCLNMTSWQWSRYGQGDSPTGTYLVIDLAGGPSAPMYPVSSLAAVPPGGWTDEYKTSKLVMRRIPAGAFTMGSPEDELGRDSDEPLHQVTLTKDFYIGVFEVTQKQWERVMGTWPSYFHNAAYRDSRPVETVSCYDIRENPNNSPISPNWPASSQVYADSFMGKLRARTGLATLDLPTESQWEYACRAGTATALNSGRNLTAITNCPNMSAVGRYWFNGGSGYSQGCAPDAGTALVGTYQPNGWGLYDMHGNVWEWCLDWYGTYPGTATDPPGEVSGTCRVLRGGSWRYFARYCLSANRFYFCYPSVRYFISGFRLSMTLP